MVELANSVVESVVEYVVESVDREKGGGGSSQVLPLQKEGGETFWSC